MRYLSHFQIPDIVIEVIDFIKKRMLRNEVHELNDRRKHYACDKKHSAASSKSI